MSQVTGHYDVAVVGGGIVGIANALSAAKRGNRVAIFDRDVTPCGASIRNFGMIWPVGQPAGELFELAMESRSIWLEIAAHTPLWVNRCGSLHVAHRRDELAVLEEFVAERGTDMSLNMLTPQEAVRHSPGLRRDGLLAAMWSPHELGVNPPRAIPVLLQYLTDRYAVDCHLGTAINRLESDTLWASDGRRWRAGQIIICSGVDFQTLLPAEFESADVRRCKLHMMKTRRQPDGFRIGPHLASGLTLRHYRSFEGCESLATLRQRVAEETPELDRLGIHVMASQNEDGEVILGDSHEYGTSSPFDAAEIDELILRELRKQFDLPDWTIAARWHGFYAKHDTRPMVVLQPSANIHVCVGTGGSGMTMSFGLAERLWENTSYATQGQLLA